MYAKLREHGATRPGKAWWEAGKAEDEMTANPGTELLDDLTAT